MIINISGQMMHSKIYKAKLITSHIDPNSQISSNPTEKAQSIHTYFGILQHIFHRNKKMIRQLKRQGVKLKNKQQIQGRLVQQENHQSDQVGNQLKQNRRQIRFSEIHGKNNDSLLKISKEEQERYHTIQKFNDNDIHAFVPLGQASHSERVNKRSIQFIPQKLGTISSFLLDPARPEKSRKSQSYCQRSYSVVKRKSVKINKNVVNNGCEASVETNHSSICSSQNYFYHQKPRNSSQSVAPW